MSNQKKRKKKLLTPGMLTNVLLVSLILAIGIMVYSAFEQFLVGDYYVETEEVEMYVMNKDRETLLEKDRYGNPVEVVHYFVNVQEDEVEDYGLQAGVCDTKGMYQSVKEGDKVLMKKYIYRDRKTKEVSDVTFEFVESLEGK